MLHVLVQHGIVFVYDSVKCVPIEIEVRKTFNNKKSNNKLFKLTANVQCYHRHHNE